MHAATPQALGLYTVGPSPSPYGLGGECTFSLLILGKEYDAVRRGEYQLGIGVPRFTIQDQCPEAAVV